MLNEVSLWLMTSRPLRLMGLLQSCLEKEWESKRMESRGERERGRVGGYCNAQHNGVFGGWGLRGSRWIYVAPLVLHLSWVWTSPSLHV